MAKPKLTSGMLFSLGGGLQIGRFANELAAGAGGGRFTPMAAAAAAEWIREGLLNESRAVERLGAGTWAVLADHYAKAKLESGFTGHMGELSGAMASAIAVVRRTTAGVAGRGTRTVGFDESVKGSAYKIKNGQLVDTGDKVPVKLYAEKFELGYAGRSGYKNADGDIVGEGRGAQPARPFMHEGIRSFVKIEFKQWSDMVQKVIDASLAANIRYTAPKGEAPAMRNVVVGTDNMGKLLTNVEKAIEYIEDVSEQYEKYIDKLFETDGYFDTQVKGFGMEVRDKVAKEIVKHIGFLTAQGDPAVALEIKNYALTKVNYWFPRKTGGFDL